MYDCQLDVSPVTILILILTNALSQKTHGGAGKAARGSFVLLKVTCSPYSRPIFTLILFYCKITSTGVGIQVLTSFVQHLKQFMLLFDLNQIISDPSRTTINSSTTFDLILTSDRHKLCNSGVIDIGLNDHSLIFCTRKVVKGAINKHNSVKVMSLKITTLQFLRINF